MELAKQNNVPIGGKDFKTGQTLMKTILAPGFKARLLGVEGWYSTNILGNRDGEVLDDPESFKSKEVSKLGSLEHILQPHLYPDLYGDMCHVVRINYYPPRGDNKEGWDNIDIFGVDGLPDADQDRLPLQGLESWRRRSSSTWRCSWTWRSAAGWAASRSGCRSTGRAHRAPRASTPRARSVHPAHEAEEHAPSPAR